MDWICNCWCCLALRYYRQRLIFSFFFMSFLLAKIQVGNLWKSQTSLFQLLASHISKYPRMQLQDIFKLLYQGTMGPVHALKSPAVFIRRFKKEYEKLESNKDEPLWESIRPDGQLVRVNLRAYKARTNNHEMLVTLCLWSAECCRGSKDDLLAAWHTFKKLCRSGRIQRYEQEKIADFTKLLDENGYKAGAHSRTYRRLYKPSYRLICRKFLSLFTS